MTSEEGISKCLLLLCVAPPFMFTFDVISGPPTKRLAVRSPSLGVYHYNNLDMRTFCEQNCFWTITLYFNFLSVGIVDSSFQSAETGKYATPTRHLNFRFAPLAVSYELFPWWNQRQLDFFSIEPNSILQFTSEKVLVSCFRKKCS